MIKNKTKNCYINIDKNKSEKKRTTIQYMSNLVICVPGGKASTRHQ